MVIGPAQHDDADPVFALQLVEHLARSLANVGLVIRQRLEADFDRAVVLFQRQTHDWLPRLQHLMGEQFPVGEIQDRIYILHVVLGKDVVLFGECRLHRFGRCGDRRAGVRAHDLDQRRSKHVVHREEDDVQRLLAVLLLNQVVDVGDADLGGEAGIDCAPARARAVEIRTGVIGVDDIFRLHAQAFEVSVEQRRVGVNVQHPRNADAEFLAIFHERDTLFGGLVPEFRCRDGIGHALGVDRPKYFVRGDFYEIRMLVFDFIDSRLDVLHVIDIFDQAFFAGGDDQALLAVHERDLGDFLDGHEGSDRSLARCGYQ